MATLTKIKDYQGKNKLFFTGHLIEKYDEFGTNSGFNQNKGELFMGKRSKLKKPGS